MDNPHRARPGITVILMNPAEVCRAHAGTARWSTLRANGVTRAHLRRALASQEVVRVGRGIYAVPSARHAAILAAAWHGRPTCVTALRAWGLPAPTVDSRIHLAIHRDRSLKDTKTSASAVRLHWHRGSLDGAATALGALDAASLCLADVDQLAAIDAALNRGLITTRDLERLVITPRHRAQWLRRHCDPDCQSPPETFVRVALREAGLEVATQVQVAGVGRVDLVVDGSVVVEVDGKTYHMNERAYWVDRRRDRVTQLGTMIALRFTREDVDRNLAGVVREVGEAVAVQRRRANLPMVRVRSARPGVPWARARVWSSSPLR